MMKTEAKEEQPQFFSASLINYQITKPNSMSFETPSKPDADEYQPTQDTLAEFYAHSFNTSLLDPSSSYTLAQMQYAQATTQQPTLAMHYYEMPQMTIYPTEYDNNVPVYATAAAPSPAYSPPPQDPSSVTVTKTKKRIQAVPCHSNSICANCKTKETTLWRRNHVGEIECNACNLYFRKNNRKRPLSLRKDGILKRNRKPRCESPATSRSST